MTIDEKILELTNNMKLEYVQKHKRMLFLFQNEKPLFMLEFREEHDVKQFMIAFRLSQFDFSKITYFSSSEYK